MEHIQVIGKRDGIMSIKKSWVIIEGDADSECLRCGYVGKDHAENDNIFDKDGECEVFCPICRSTHLYLIENY